jgi:hypothetical protein
VRDSASEVRLGPYSAEIRRGSPGPGGRPDSAWKVLNVGAYYRRRDGTTGMPVALALALLNNRHVPLVQVGEHLPSDY